MIKTEIFKLDRIEEGVAVIENPEGEMEYFPASSFPENAKSGDCFAFENGVFKTAEKESKKRRSLISSLLDEIVTEK